MAITLNLPLAVVGYDWNYLPSHFQPGAWAIEQISNTSSMPSYVVATSTAPNGWSVTPDNTVTPTTLTVESPFGLEDFYLSYGYLQNGPDLDSVTGYGRDNANTMNLPDYARTFYYRVRIKSTEVVNRPIGQGSAAAALVYSNSFDVVSYGPLAVIEGEFGGSSSGAGGRTIRQRSSEVTTYYPLTGNIVTYEWEARYPANTFESGELIATGEGPDFEFDDPGEVVNVRLTVTNNFGKVGYTTIQSEGADRISAMADHDGVGYAAVKESGALMVKQYTSGKASEVIRATLPGFDSPSLYQLSDSTRFYLSARDTATGEYAFFYSDDHCKTFVEVS